MSPQDRELLEAAAKASGLDFRWDAGFLGEVEEPTVFDEEGFGDYWNPLVDDGDALRLAVQTGEPFVVRTRCVTTMGGLKEDFDPSIRGDDLRAVRRIIVRAASIVNRSQS